MTAPVSALDPTRVPQVVDTLAEAFHDYPVMRFVIGPDASAYEHRLTRLVHFFVMARVFRGETMLGAGGGFELDGAALVSRPSGEPSPPELGALREEVWSVLGADARERYQAFGEACTPFQVDEPHLHLNMIGVRERARGTGLGRVLAEHVHGLSRMDPHSRGVTLTTEDPANVAFYEHLGYDVVGRTEVAPELTTWGFYRPDSMEAPV